MNLLEVKLPAFDPEVDEIIRAEMRRNEDTINLIASENYPPKSAMKAISSMLSGIYSEGYPGERWYRGLENIDKLESLAIARAKAAFGAEHANVQALSGSNANIAAYLAAAGWRVTAPVIATQTPPAAPQTSAAVDIDPEPLADEPAAVAQAEAAILAIADGEEQHYEDPGF